MDDFMGEVALAELWSLINAEDSKVTSAMTALANSKAKIEMFSYDGTGDFGSGNVNRLAFSFAPKIVFMLGYTYKHYDLDRWVGLESQYTEILMSLLSTSYGNYSGFSTATATRGECLAKKSADGKTLEWYTTNSNDGATGQLNQSGYTYYGFAIG